MRMCHGYNEFPLIRRNRLLESQHSDQRQFREYFQRRAAPYSQLNFNSHLAACVLKELKTKTPTEKHRRNRYHCYLFIFIQTIHLHHKTILVVSYLSHQRTSQIRIPNYI